MQHPYSCLMFLAKLDYLLFPEPVSSGMNPFVLMSLAQLYRSGNGHADPIVVSAVGSFYRIADGRHRAVAAMIAGRKVVLAELVDIPPEPV
jgi:hypothetical protein